MAMFIHFFCLSPLSLTIKMNFDISKVAYLIILKLIINYYLILFKFILRVSCKLQSSIGLEVNHLTLTSKMNLIILNNYYLILLNSS